MEQWTIKEIRQYTGMTQVGFAEYTGIPVRSLEQWETGKRTPPKYVLKLLQRVVIEDVTSAGRFDVGGQLWDIGEPIRATGKGVRPMRDQK